MKTQHFRFALLLPCLICLPLVAFAQDKTPPEAYSGVAMGTGGSVGGKTIQRALSLYTACGGSSWAKSRSSHQGKCQDPGSSFAPIFDRHFWSGKGKQA